MTKPSQERERTLCRTFFLAPESISSTKAICSLQKKEFLSGLDEASGLPYSEGQQEALIACHYNLAVAEQRLGHSEEALSWIRLAEEEQDKLGRTVLPEITPARQKLESIATSFR